MRKGSEETEREWRRRRRERQGDRERLREMYQMTLGQCPEQLLLTLALFAMIPN